MIEPGKLKIESALQDMLALRPGDIIENLGRPRDADLRSRGGPDIVRTVDAGQRHSRTCGGQQGLRRQAIKYDGRLEVAGPKFIDECRTDGAGEREIVQARVVG